MRSNFDNLVSFYSVALFAGARKRLRWCVVVWLVGNGVYLLFLVVVLVFVLALLSFAGMESSVVRLTLLGLSLQL